MTKSRTFVYALALAVIAAAIFISPSVHSQTAVLQLINGATTVTVADQSGSDSNSTVGVVTYVGAVGDFETNVTTGSSKPITGNATGPVLSLASLNITNTSNTAETITLLFSDNGFGPTTGFPQAALSVTQLGQTPPSPPNGSVTYNNYWDASNVTLAQTSLLTSIGPVTTGTESAIGALGSFAAPYALTQVLTITLNAGGTFLGSADLVIVPEANGVLMSVLVALVLGIGFGRRRLIKS